MALQVPNPNGPKFIAVQDAQGGPVYNVVVSTSKYGTNMLQLDNLIASYQATGLLLAKATAVNLNAAGDQPLFTCPSGVSCFVRAILITNASTSLTTVSLSIGWNAGTDNNIVANATHTELTTASLYTWLTIISGAAVGAAAGVLNLKNNILQGGAATADLYVYGFLQ